MSLTTLNTQLQIWRARMVQEGKIRIVEKRNDV